MKYYLMKFACDYSDEFNVYGVHLMTEDEWTQLQADLETVKYPTEVGFGTNEELYFNSSKDIISSIKPAEITEATYNELFPILKWFSRFPSVEPRSEYTYNGKTYVEEAHIVL